MILRISFHILALEVKNLPANTGDVRDGEFSPWAGQEEGRSGKIWALLSGCSPWLPRGRPDPSRNVQHLEPCSVSQIPWDQPAQPRPAQYWAHSELGAQTGTEERGSRAVSQAWTWGFLYSGP